MFPRNTNHHEPVDDLRLIAAADHILRVTGGHPHAEARVSAWTGDPLHVPAGSFTVDELVAAVQFLRRLGTEVPCRASSDRRSDSR